MASFIGFPLHVFKCENNSFNFYGAFYSSLIGKQQPGNFFGGFETTGE